MKPNFIPCTILSVLAVVLCACHKQDPVSELEKTAAAMAKAEAAPAPANPVDTSARPAPAAPAGPPPARMIQEAVADYKAGKMEDAVTRLQILRNMPSLSPQQRMALQDSVAAVMTEVYSLAEKGDPRAIAAVARYEKMQTSR